MTGAKLRWIIALMSIAVVGLIAFQWYWIGAVISANQERFRSDIHSVLENVVLKLEKEEIKYLVNQRRIIDQLTHSQERFESPVGSFQYEFHGTPDSMGFNFQLSVDATGQLQFEGAKSNPNNAFKNQPFPSNVNEPAIGSALDKVGRRSEMFANVLQELMVPKRIGNRINPKDIDSLINAELSEKGIPLAYNFGVIKPLEGRFVSISDPDRNQEVANSEYKAYLFPNDVMGDPSVLSIYFPGESNFLLGRMWLIMLSSGVLIMIILLCFGYAVFTIVRQKNISEMKNDFINNMTHELKTPIATIGLAVEALQDREIASIDSMRNRYTKVIGEENVRLGSQVEKVLQMALIDKRELNLSMETVDFHEVIEKAVGKMTLQIESKGGTLSTVYGASETIISADVSHLLNVVINLLDNAIKYSEDKPKIMLRTQNSSTHVSVSIKDHGVGMSREEVKHIFQRFYRVPTGNLHNVKGFGLGLTYVKSVVEMMSGEIDVDSELGHGTDFVVKFPLKL